MHGLSKVFNRHLKGNMVPHHLSKYLLGYFLARSVSLGGHFLGAEGVLRYLCT